MKATSSDPRRLREARFLSSFLALSKISARLIEQREAPDFLLEVDGRQVGLEVTEIHVPTPVGDLPLQAEESILSRVVAGAQRRYEDRGGAPLFVGICIAPNADLRGIDRDETADALAKFMLASAPSGDETLDWRAPPVGSPLPPCFASLIARAQETAGWWAPRGRWVTPLAEETVQERINDKAKKLVKYREAAAEVWLLLAIEGVAPSQIFDLNAEIRPSVICSPFDRTFLLSVVNGRCDELCVAT